MKFDPFCWNEVATNAKVPTGKGRLQLRLSAPAPVYIEAEGYEALAGFGASFDLDLSEAVTFRVEAPKAVRAFFYRPLATAVEAAGEVFTNIDRMPMESGAVEEVTRARRMLEMERRKFLREIRAERDRAVSAAREANAPAKVVTPGGAEVEPESAIVLPDDGEATE